MKQLGVLPLSPPPSPLSWNASLPHVTHHHCVTCLLPQQFVKFEPTTLDISQHIATGWPNVCNMLPTTMLSEICCFGMLWSFCHMASPPSRHQHCIDEAHKAKTVLSAVSYSWIHCWQSVFQAKFIWDYEARCFSLKGMASFRTWPYRPFAFTMPKLLGRESALQWTGHSC